MLGPERLLWGQHENKSESIITDLTDESMLTMQLHTVGGLGIVGL